MSAFLIFTSIMLTSISMADVSAGDADVAERRTPRLRTTRLRGGNLYEYDFQQDRSDRSLLAAQVRYKTDLIPYFHDIIFSYD